jgi:RimJ/RimL family protein N-acetyltransferase
VTAWRRLGPGDAAALARALADPDLGAWVVGDEREFLAELPADTFAMVEDELLALVVVIPERDPESFELAYWTAPAARGRGLATAGLGHAAAFALRELGAQRLWVEIDPANSASHRVAEKAGFTREGVLRAHCRDRRTGLRHDCVVYSLLPGEG